MSFRHLSFDFILMRYLFSYYLIMKKRVKLLWDLCKVWRKSFFFNYEANSLTLKRWYICEWTIHNARVKLICEYWMCVKQVIFTSTDIKYWGYSLRPLKFLKANLIFRLIYSTCLNAPVAIRSGIIFSWTPLIEVLTWRTPTSTFDGITWHSSLISFRPSMCVYTMFNKKVTCYRFRT